MYGGGGVWVEGDPLGCISRDEFHIGSGATENGRSRCKRREGPGTTLNPPPSCCLGVVVGLSARSVGASLNRRPSHPGEASTGDEDAAVEWVGSSA